MPGARLRDPRGLRPPVPDRAAAVDEQIADLPWTRRVDAAQATTSASPTSIREHAARAGDAVAMRHGERELTLRGARRALEPARAGAAGARVSAPGDRVAYLDRTRAGGGRAAVRGEQDRRGARAAQLAARAARAGRRARATPGAAADRRARLRRAGGGARRRARRELRRGRRRSTRRGWPHTPRRSGSAAAGPDDVVVQMYTSGTTGVPKGVLTTHRNLAAAAETSPLLGVRRQPVSLTPLPMFHIGGIGWAFVRALERRDDDPRERVRPRGRARHARAPARDERRVRADDAPDADRGPGRRRARLLGAALDRLRRVADHDARAEGGAADVSAARCSGSTG